MEECHAHKRRFREFEPARPIFPEISFQAGFLLRRRKLSPILLIDGYCYRAQRNLKWFDLFFPDKACAQDSMSICYPLPGALKSCYIEFPSKSMHRLLNMYARLRSPYALKEHALLGRRERNY